MVLKKFEKGSKFKNALSEQTKDKVCQNSLPTVLRNRHVVRALAYSIISRQVSILIPHGWWVYWVRGQTVNSEARVRIPSRAHPFQKQFFFSFFKTKNIQNLKMILRNILKYRNDSNFAHTFLSTIKSSGAFYHVTTYIISLIYA